MILRLCSETKYVDKWCIINTDQHAPLQTHTVILKDHNVLAQYSMAPEGVTTVIKNNQRNKYTFILYEVTPLRNHS